MYSKFLKKGIALGVLTSAVLIPNDKVLAAEAKNAEGVSTVNINKGYLANATAEIERYVETELKNVYEDMAFTQVEEGSYLFVRTEPSQDSEWVGKLYEADAAKVIGPVGEWTQIESGNVTGYVKTEYILTGESAEEKAKAIVAEKKPEVDVETLDEVTAEDLAAECFSYAESKEEEAVRLAEEAAKAAEEKAKAESKVQEQAQGNGGCCNYCGGFREWAGCCGLCNAVCG